MGCRLALQSGGCTVLIFHLVPLSEPVQAPGETTSSDFFLRVLFLTQAPWAPMGTQARGEHQGSSLSPPPWLDAPFFLSSLMLVVRLERRDMVWGAGDPVPGERAGYQLCGCGAATNFSACLKIALAARNF